MVQINILRFIFDHFFYKTENVHSLKQIVLIFYSVFGKAQR